MGQFIGESSSVSCGINLRNDRTTFLYSYFRAVQFVARETKELQQRPQGNHDASRDFYRRRETSSGSWIQQLAVAQRLILKSLKSISSRSLRRYRLSAESYSQRVYGGVCFPQESRNFPGGRVPRSRNDSIQHIRVCTRIFLLFCDTKGGLPRKGRRAIVAERTQQISLLSHSSDMYRLYVRSASRASPQGCEL